MGPDEREVVRAFARREWRKTIRCAADCCNRLAILTLLWGLAVLLAGDRGESAFMLASGLCSAAVALVLTAVLRWGVA